MIQVPDEYLKFIQSKLERRLQNAAQTTSTHTTLRKESATSEARGDYPDEHNSESWSQNYEDCRARDIANRAASETSREGFEED
jgi:hypothetical protein